MVPGRMPSARRNVLLLAGCHALAFASTSTLLSVSVLVGQALAPSPSLATLPITAAIAGIALATMPASLVMKRTGRRRAFIGGALVGVQGALVMVAALSRQSFVLFCLGMLLFGTHGAVTQYYRFAAAEATSPEHRATAISFVLGGGVLGALVGPEVSKWTVGLFAPRYAGAYWGIAVYTGMAALLAAALRLPAPDAEEESSVGRPLTRIAAQPRFVVAVLGSGIGYAVMSLLMVATPLAMSGSHHSYGHTALVIQWHVVAMFAPSFVTGYLVRRLGALGVMLLGALLQGGCIAVSLAGTQVVHFWVALVLLGVGWNFLYIGGTTLLTETYRPAERARSQGLNEAVVTVMQMIGSAGAGWLVTRAGWAGPNTLAVPAVALVAAAIVWLMRQGGNR
jgi:MFS family permease